ncbi:MAG: peptidylprolyl isomerase [Elusimicrobia bacterium]|nr:peptidylprolyl isomerase [Elusimicrobiota bacterium]
MKRLSLCLFTLIGLTGLAFAAKLTNRPIATVNGEAILLSEYEKNWASLLEQAKEGMPADKLDDAWKKNNREKLLDQMIADRVLLQEAKKNKVRVNQREFENGVAQVRARFLPERAQKELQGILRRQYAALGAEANESALDFPAALKELEKSNPAAVKEANATFAAELAKEGIDQKKFEDRIRDQLSVMELSKEAVRARAKPPTEEEAKKLFDRIQLKLQGKPVPGLAGEDEKDLDSMAKFYTQQTGERVRARHILISVPSENGAPTGWATATLEQKSAARKKILDLKNQIKKGADFADLATKNSVDKGSAANGGDLGFFTRGQMVPPFEKAAFALGVGQVSDVVESPFGLHLIQVEEKKAASKLRFEDAEDDIKEYLFRAGQQKALQDYVTEMRQGAQVKITLPTAD